MNDELTLDMVKAAKLKALAMACDKAPPDFYCTRGLGHQGPCKTESARFIRVELRGLRNTITFTP